MSFAFKSGSSVQSQVRRIALEEIDDALAEARGDGDGDAIVHGLRRHCKKLRGLLRLIRPGFSEFKLENGAIRDIANKLSGARDAAVMVETFNGVVKQDRESGAIPPPVRQSIADLLESQAEAKARRDNADMLQEFGKAMEQVRLRAAGWTLERKGFAALGDGLEITYRAMRDAMQSAAGEPEDEAFHEWRKSAKAHWYHTRLFGRAAPDVLDARKKQLSTLGELLGDHHNLAVLRQSLELRQATIGHKKLQPVQDMIVAQQADLAQRAFELGRQLAAEKPSALRDRYRRYWALME